MRPLAGRAGELFPRARGGSVNPLSFLAQSHGRTAESGVGFCVGIASKSCFAYLRWELGLKAALKVYFFFFPDAFENTTREMHRRVSARKYARLYLYRVSLTLR